ncbi:unnamed protein product [Closterium sp. NIES-53]
MTTLRVLLHVAAQRDYELHSLDFSTAFLQGSLHEEIWLRRLPGFTGSFPGLGGGGCVASLAPPPPSSPTAAAVAEGGGCVGVYGVVLGGWSVSRARV